MSNLLEPEGEYLGYIDPYKIFLRDQFAMAALTGIIMRDYRGRPFVEQAYSIADDMIKQRGVK